MHAETVARLYDPDRVLIVLFGAVFLVAGVVSGAMVMGDVVNASSVIRIGLPGLFSLIGGLVLAVGLGRWCRPGTITHADATVLPDLVRTPIIMEGMHVVGNLSHKLQRTGDGWALIASRFNRRWTQFWLWGFGPAFLLGVSAMLGWVLHTEFGLGLTPSLVVGTLLSLLSVGTALVFMIVTEGLCRERLRQVCCADGVLTITGPHQQSRTLSVATVTAVQACACRINTARSRLSAVQVLLVVEEDGQREREPLLLCRDQLRTPVLARALADALDVPYLHHVTAADWRSAVLVRVNDVSYASH